MYLLLHSAKCRPCYMIWINMMSLFRTFDVVVVVVPTSSILPAPIFLDKIDFDTWRHHSTPLVASPLQMQQLTAVFLFRSAEYQTPTLSRAFQEPTCTSQPWLTQKPWRTRLSQTPRGHCQTRRSTLQLRYRTFWMATATVDQPAPTKSYSGSTPN